MVEGAVGGKASVLWNRLTDYNKGAKEDDYGTLWMRS
jgi:hypothetical protein